MPIGAVTAQANAHLASAIDLGALMQRDGLEQWQGTTQLAPALQLDQRWAQFGFDGSLLASDRRLSIDHGTAGAALSPSPLGAFRWSIDAHAERLTSRIAVPRSALTMQSSLSYAKGSGGAWLGAAVEGSPDADSIPAVPLLRLGFWQRIGDVLLTLSSSSHAMKLGGHAASFHTITHVDTTYTDTAPPIIHETQRIFGDSGQASRTTLWSDMEVGAAWSHGPIALDATIGARPAVSGFQRAVWGRVTTITQLSSRISLIASGGNDPARIEFGIPQSRIATVGFRVSSAALLRPQVAIPIRTSAAAFSLRRAGENSYVVSVRVPRARTVELSGDFGLWKALPLDEVHPDVWETTLVLTPGTYHVNIRVDGDQWKAPPGLPTVPDDFNGTVGIIVVH